MKEKLSSRFVEIPTLSNESIKLMACKGIQKARLEINIRNTQQRASTHFAFFKRSTLYL